MGVIMFGLCWGCAGVERKFDDWQSAIREKLNFKMSKDGSTDGKDRGEKFYIHTSQWSWESLDHLALWYTGDSKNAKVLADMNPAVNPAKIAAGSEVAIPVSLMKTREPLPKNFANEYRKDAFQHTVHWPGESLSLIASWYTGASQNWRKLARTNPDLDPNRIKGGQVIMIPSALLKTRVPLPQKVAAKYTSHYFAHRVQEDNEKLADIARWYTGDSINRNRLALANPDLNPDHLTKGDEVYIPRRLLKTRQPIISGKPASPPATPAAKVPAPEPKTALVEDEQIKLFGPKQFPQD
jgi:hypothetical protein